MKKINENNFSYANNDKNGNARVIVHFSEFLTEDEKNNMLTNYNIAYKRAKQIYNLREYKGADFGGGFIFQAVDKSHAERKVAECFK